MRPTDEYEIAHAATVALLVEGAAVALIGGLFILWLAIGGAVA